jgi:RNA polymerase II subunit A-like phosphatase
VSNSDYIPMLHAEPHIKVDMDEALELSKRDLVKLVKSRKLVLLVDLDHTVIHTTNEHVNPNLKEIHHYELSHPHIWYHTKFRPRCIHFLEEMSKIFELHVVTFGERMYAHKIANLMDPQRKYFHDRILSRNEIFNPVSKTDNLK